MLGVFIEAGEGWTPNPVIAEALRSGPKGSGGETPLQRPISLRTLLPNARAADGSRPYVNYRCVGRRGGGLGSCKVDSLGMT